GVELVMRASLGATGDATLGYELRALWPGAPAPLRGTIALRGQDRVGFAAVLRDQLHRLARATPEDAQASGANPAPAAGTSDPTGGAPGAAGDQPGVAPDPHDVPGVGDVAVVLGIALFVLATPIMLGA